MKVTIDRFEGDFAVVELSDGQLVNMPKQIIPKGAKEGAVISISIDHDETQERKERLSKLMNSLMK